MIKTVQIVTIKFIDEVSGAFVWFNSQYVSNDENGEKSSVPYHGGKKGEKKGHDAWGEFLDCVGGDWLETCGWQTCLGSTVGPPAERSGQLDARWMARVLRMRGRGLESVVVSVEVGIWTVQWRLSII